MHSVVEAAEKILDKEYKVLDHGFVRLVDYMGSDDRIVQSARVSYGEGTKTYRQDKGLINYLLRNDHTSPFEQVVFTFHVKMPIFVARQWVRHRTGRMNEISGRYSVMKDEQERIFNNYHELLDMGIAREISRIDLPLSLYTEFYWQMDLHNLFHFLALRLDGHAQYEIREYARTMFEIVKIVCPIAAEAFENHKLNGVSLSGREKEAVKKILSGEENPLSGREKEIFLAKLN